MQTGTMSSRTDLFSSSPSAVTKWGGPYPSQTRPTQHSYTGNSAYHQDCPNGIGGTEHSIVTGPQAVSGGVGTPRY